MQHGPTGDWSALSAGGLSAHFIADGGLYNLLNGWIYGYDTSRSIGFFQNHALNAWRFMYNYDLGQWYHMGAIGGWAVLGASNLAGDFLGDGNGHSLGNGFDFQYAYLDDTGDFTVGSSGRFRYDYAVGQWWHKGPTGDWLDLGISGFTAKFIGDGSLYNLGDGWTFGYDGGSGMGFFRSNALNAWRFMYNYGAGQWYHMGNSSGWGAITASDYSAEFIGDGEWHELGDNWSYSYSSSSDYGYFKIRDSDRFYYGYGASQWYHKGNATDWAALSGVGYSALFIGNGQTHDLGNGVSYYYTTTGDNGWFKVNDSERFWYKYSADQWYHKGDNTSWGALSATGVSAQFVGDGEWHDLGNGFSYSYASTGKHGYFKLGAFERFLYNYGPSQWSHKANNTTWSMLTDEEYSAAFIGDGKSHYLANGVSYYYTISGDNGWFNIGGHERFWYAYTGGQWYHHRGSGGSWQALGTAGVSSRFIGDGGWHDLGNGWNYSYAHSSDYAYFKTGSAERFYYAYGPGKWYHKGDATAWIALTAADYSLAFIGDGAEHDLGNGWSYSYFSSGDYGAFETGSAQRLSYRYGPSQWYHKGNTTDWAVLSAAGVSAQFVGDGGWYDLGLGFTYSYLSASDYGYFKVGTAQRFYYAYGPSQWYHKGDTTDWAALTSGNYSAAFIGDGSDHDLGNGFAYSYSSTDDSGYFKLAAGARFSYGYVPGQWFHKSNHSDWAALTAVNNSAEFVGDGVEHGLGNGWSYYYTVDSDNGWFKTGGHERFWYNYKAGQWSHHRAGTGSWYTLSAAGVSALFVGDGSEHDLGTGWIYSYLSSSDYGYFKTGNDQRFYYGYGPGQWYHKGDTTDWGALSATGVSAQFVGDGGWYDVGNGFSYQYVTADKEGYFKLGDAQRFYYTYGSGQWFHKGNATDWVALTAIGNSAEFVGDGQWHDLGTGWSYQHVGGDSGYFKLGDAIRFSYWYVQSQWFHKGDNTDLTALSATGVSADFVGDGQWHDLGTGWSYMYSHSTDYGWFKTGNHLRYYYSYGPGQWFHRGSATEWGELSATGVSAAFVGDGAWHDLGTGWSYQHVGGDSGYFKLGDALRFSYWYVQSQWFHRGNHSDLVALTGTEYSAQFIGDGAEHDIGNQWHYEYLIASDYGSFIDHSGSASFAYSYAPGQWLHKGNTANWGVLSATNCSIAFMGDGAWHDLGNGWSYWYDRGDSDGVFKAGSLERFSYNYTVSQWSHRGASTGWGVISAQGVSAEFLGDGNWIDLGNGFTYRYLAADDTGHFKVGADERFYFGYGASRWFHRGHSTDWAALTGSHFAAQFIGDGGWYDLGNGFSYHYDLGVSLGYFKRGDTGQERFCYWYGSSQWAVRSDHWDWVWLSVENTSSAQFVGDGGWHDLGSGWWYFYALSIDTGYWGKGDSPSDWTNQRFNYCYRTGLWNHKGNHGDYHPLGSRGWWNPSFLGDGAEHWVNDEHRYKYSFNYGLDHGYWDDHTGVGTEHDYRYFYDAGEWWEYFSGRWWCDDPHGGVSTYENNPQ